MSTRNHWIAAGFVVGGAVSATFGMIVRDRMDLPMVSRGPFGEAGPLVASRDNHQDLTEIPEREYFEQMSELLKREYVDPIGDDQKLIAGAVRGMVGSLEDPRSLFMDADQFRVFQEARKGSYEGIGVDFKLVLPPKKTDAADGPFMRVPKLVIAAVVPGGPADQAGLKPGDVVDTLDAHWVLNNDLLDAFRDLQRKVLAKQASSEALRKMREDLRTRMDKSMMPMRARERMLVGTDGSVDLIVLRNGKPVTAKIARGKSTLTPVTLKDGVFVVHLQPGVGEALTSQLPKTGQVKLDLRNNAFADTDVLLEALRALAPSGNYGVIANERGKTTPLTVANGRADKLTYSIRVDRSTASAAEILSLALAEKGLAKLEGGSVAGDPTVAEVIKLPDGSGFTLLRGNYRAEVKK